MIKYIYCLVRDVVAEPDAFPPGLDGAKVYHISSRAISALISDIHSHQLVGNLQNALVHQEVVDAALRHSKSVIPCRFGTWFPDDKKILMVLKKHYARLDAQLTKLEGKMEVSVQTIFNQQGAGADPTTTPQKPKEKESEKPLTIGTSYLLKKKEQFDAIKELEEEADRFSEELSQAMSPFWSDVKAQKRSTDEKLLLSVCYLVEQQKLSSFKHAYQNFKKRKPNLKLLYTGPWAPYTFADIDLHADKE